MMESKEQPYVFGVPLAKVLKYVPVSVIVNTKQKAELFL